MDFWSPGSKQIQEVKVRQSRLQKRKRWMSRRELLRLSEAGWWGRFRQRSGCATPPPPSLGGPWCPSTAPLLLALGWRTPAEPANTPQLKSLKPFLKTRLCVRVRRRTHLSETLFPPHGAPAVEFHQQRAVLVERSQQEVERFLPLALTLRGLQRSSLLRRHRPPRLLHLHLDEKGLRQRKEVAAAVTYLSHR